VPRVTDANVHLKCPHMFYVIGEALVAFPENRWLCQHSDNTLF